jgi:hypothetical protein
MSAKRWHWAVTLCVIALWAIIVTSVALSIGCAATETRTETRTTTNTVSVPSPVACFNAADLPALPPKTVVNADRATTDQLAAAAAADAEAYELYARAVDRLWAQCAKGLTK